MIRRPFLYPSGIPLAELERVKSGGAIRYTGPIIIDGEVDKHATECSARCLLSDMRDAWLVDEGYIAVERPQPLEDGDYAIFSYLTEQGEIALAILSRGLVFSKTKGGVDLKETKKWYFDEDRRMLYLSNYLAAQKVEHPVRDEILHAMERFITLCKLLEIEPTISGTYTMPREIEL